MRYSPQSLFAMMASALSGEMPPMDEFLELPEETRYPHGRCECACKPHVCGGVGPAAHAVTRNGKPLKVCTRCILISDIEKAKIVDGNTDRKPYAAWDPDFYTMLWDTDEVH